ncbi:MAG TPA: HAD family phosphatase [Rhabdochlamydiaceae bacterium]|jgi:HAD superfamily hydrolase (TIGR01509 family)
MKWIEQFQLFLFDFDGILVDTEYLHYSAYVKMCALRGFSLEWDFEHYCTIAHRESQGIRKALLSQLPALAAQEPNWDALYAEKKKCYMQLLENSENLQLLPGVESLLRVLHERNIAHCVVTNSPREHIEMIRALLPSLQRIPHWITREDYTLPKPSPEGYQKALSLYPYPKEKVIGFEDTLKGFQALHAVAGQCVLICPPHRTHIPECLALGGTHFPSFPLDLIL